MSPSLFVRRPATRPSTASSSPTSSRSGYSSHLSDASGPITALPSMTSASDADSCTFDVNDYFAQLRGELQVSDDCPGPKQLKAAGDIPIYDAEGKARPFGSLFHGDDVIGERQLVLFVRHFYCGACQAYLRALTSNITPQTYFTMNIPTSIIVIGCGSPRMINAYKQFTGCPFPIYADPTRQLYRSLGMSWTLDFGLNKRPQYMKDIAPPAWLAGQLKQVSKARGRDGFRGGNWLQIGGEFLFKNGEVVWCHRMRHYRDHTEVDTLRKLLDIGMDD